MDPIYHKGLVWLRRDLRTHDHTALHHALTRCQQVWVVFVFDPEILEPLPRDDRRLSFIVHSLNDVDAHLQQLAQHKAHHDQGGLIVLNGPPEKVITQLAEHLKVQAVFAHQDHEPQAIQRDARVLGALAHHGIAFHAFYDQTLAGPFDIQSQLDRPYTSYAPYKKSWFRFLNEDRIAPREVESHAQALAMIPQPYKRDQALDVKAYGFEPVLLAHPHLLQGRSSALVALEDFRLRITHYQKARDFPAIKGPSYLSVHLRFGTLSVRELARAAWALYQEQQVGAVAWLSELAWRDFFMQVLHHHPRVVSQEFRPLRQAPHALSKKKAQVHFEAWKKGQTGLPFVDAGMRQLKQTGYMHNRLRMVTAMYLCKQLGVPWQWGEAWFAQQLLDFDLALNNGNWQWVMGTGSEANPSFRVFNPVLQSRRFDPQGKFIRRYVGEVASLSDALIHTPWLASPIEKTNLGAYPLPLIAP